jgi:hypothetical protein
MSKKDNALPSISFFFKYENKISIDIYSLIFYEFEKMKKPTKKAQKQKFKWKVKKSSENLFERDLKITKDQDLIWFSWLSGIVHSNGA